MMKKKDNQAEEKKTWKRPELIEEELRQTEGELDPPMLPGAPERAS